MPCQNPKVSALEHRVFEAGAGREPVREHENLERCRCHCLRLLLAWLAQHRHLFSLGHANYEAACSAVNIPVGVR